MHETFAQGDVYLGMYVSVLVWGGGGEGYLLGYSRAEAYLHTRVDADEIAGSEGWA